jgi:hypothetical protein
VKDTQKSALITFIFMALFFTFRNIVTVFGGSVYMLGWIDNPFQWLYSPGYSYIWLTIWGLIFILGVILVLKTNRFLDTISQFLNFFSAALVIMLGISFFQARPNSLITTSEDGNRDPFIEDWLTKQELSIQISPKTSQETLPDIYYIIFDGYAREDILESIYHFDNSQFTEQLSERGFFVAQQSRLLSKLRWVIQILICHSTI